MRPSTAMRYWLKHASAEEKKTLAKAAGTSPKHLEHLAAGRRQASAELAQRLAKGSRTFAKVALRLKQEDLCRACRVCPLRS